MTYAAIAQQVERILGKDEVASSNLASSSKRKDHSKEWSFSFGIGGVGELATSSVSIVRWTVADRLGLRPHRKMAKPSASDLLKAPFDALHDPKRKGGTPSGVPPFIDYAHR